MDISGFVAQLLNGLAGASSLFLVGAGLSLIFGVTRIVNFAHGSFYMLGIYIAYSLVQKLGGGAWFFTPLIDRLREECRVMAVDLPGTGRSPARGQVTLDGWVADLGALVRARGAAPVVLLGHSMGTIIALRAWRAWPEMIRGLVLVGGLPRARPAIRERLSDRLAALATESSLAGWGRQVSPGVFSPAASRLSEDSVNAA